MLLELATLSPPHEAVVDFKTKLPLYSIPKIYRNLIFSCLSLDPTKRPSFEIISCFFKENEQEFLKFKPAAKSSTSRHQKLESEWVEEQDVDMEPTIVSKLKRLVKTRKGFIPILVGLVLILLIAAIVVGVLVSTRSASGSAEAVNSSSASSASTISIAASATTTSPYSSPTISWSNLVNWGGVQSDYIYALNTSEQDAIISQLLASNVSVVKVVISQVSAGQAGIQSNAINDVEQSGVGLYDDTILQAIDIFMSKASKFGIKLLIAPHSRYSLGCVSKDSYVYQYNLTAVNPCASVYSSLDNITEFYTNSKIITNYDKRLQYILNHQNSYMGNVPWRTLSSAIYSFDVQHKAQAGNNVDWMCGRAQTIKSALSNSGILVSTSAIGDGASFNQTLISALLNCSNSTFDMLGLDLNVYDNSTINSILKQTTALVANISTTSRSMIKVAVENFCPRQSTRFTDIATLGYNANLLNVSWVLSSLVKGDSSSCGFNTSEPGVWQTISRDGADAMKGSSTFFIPVNYLPQGAVCRNNAQCQVSCCSDQNTNNGANICDITATNC